MTRSLAAILVGTMVVGIPGRALVGAQDKADFAGRWALNRELSEFPREIGFGVNWLSPAGSGQESTTSGGRGRRGSGGGGAAPAFPARPESADDGKRVQQLTDEVRKPSAYLTIAENPIAVTISDDRGQSRTFHPDGRREILQLDGVPVGVTAKRDAGRLVVVYNVEQDRELRYSYSRNASPPQLVVEVQFVERGGGDRVRRVYEPATAPTSTAETSPGRLPAQTLNQQPDAEFKGLTKLGIVVEGLSPQAAACGLNQATIETAVSTRLSKAGFQVLPNSDEDTYIYVNVITSSLSNGLCVSRYDAFLYTHTTAKLSYHETPVLVQVSLLHKGGIAGGAPAAHAEGVLRGVNEYVDQFSIRIRDANK
jgi:hypothetical protein